MPTEWFKRQRKLHEDLAEALGDGRVEEGWWGTKCDDLIEDAGMVEEIVSHRLEVFPPQKTLDEIARAAGVSRDRAKAVERWLITRLRGALLHKAGRKRRKR